MAVAAMAKVERPKPTKTPIDEAIQISAAVVRPWACSLVFMMMPAPKNPIPTTMLAMTVKKPLFLAMTSSKVLGACAVIM